MSSSQTELFTQLAAIEMMEMELEMKEFRSSAQSDANSDAQQRLLDTQAQVDEVVGIMRVNVEKVLERDQALSELSERADQLELGASQFVRQSGRLKRKHWWANVKLMIVLGIIAIILIGILLLYIWPAGSGEGSQVITEGPQK
ncbi:synaptobrevin-like [Drosophila biarmipes]|uniref:synaptobrevin-like n=1 Tax=Drosophila biarmipes TaxID=125945 RepID=UPI0007E7BCD2|nr:synaptobrevin-like [Drosophila biarmipes]